MTHHYYCTKIHVESVVIKARVSLVSCVTDGSCGDMIPRPSSAWHAKQYCCTTMHYQETSSWHTAMHKESTGSATLRQVKRILTCDPLESTTSKLFDYHGTKRGDT